MSLFSLVVPLYKSAPNLPRLLSELHALQARVPMDFEVVLVDDGSPDACQQILQQALPTCGFRTRLVSLSRNFGAFPAITAGLRAANGDYLAVLAADLQEPPELALEFLQIMRAGEADVVFGTRASRADSLLSTATSNLFWWVYRTWVNPDIPSGGVDVFGCTRKVRDKLCALDEVETNLIALLFWLGFRRRFVPYNRAPRTEGASAWTLAKKLRYSVNSLFGFTDLPLFALQVCGLVGVILATVGGVVVLASRLLGYIETVGYTPIVLAILFFGGMTVLGLGILGQYVWLSLQNARRRPLFVVSDVVEFEGAAGPAAPGSPRQTTA